MENEYSVNLRTKFWFKGKMYNGFINLVNIFRATIILGTPGSGKSYAIVNQFIKQTIEKAYALYIYDFKFDDLSIIAYNHLIKYRHRYKVPPKFYVINFDNPRKSHRCNPLAPELMTDISDAYESSYTIMLNLNKSWVQKQGDFFVESPIVLFTAIIWFLKLYENGKYCTFPHAIELLNKRYEDVFTILTSYPDLENYLSPPLPKGYNRLLIVFACLIIVYTVHEYPEKVNTFFFTLLVEIITYIATIWIYRGFKELP